MAEPRLLSLRSLLILMLGLVLAGASALAAFDMVHAKRAGVPAVAGPLTPGPALSHRAMSLIATHAELRDGAPIALDADIAEQARVLSAEALRRAPMDAAALRNLALIEGGSGDAAGLLQFTERLTRRDRQANVLLARIAAQKGDLAGTVSRLDQALRTSTAARREMLPLLYQALEQPGADRVIARMLAEDVNWEADFWAQAAAHESALQQLAALRITRANAGFASTPRDDRRLLAALAKARKFASAEALDLVLHPAPPRGDNALRNAAFTRLANGGAFDWDLRFDSSLTTDILPSAARGSGHLRIRTYSDGSGLAARQLVALPEARYRLDLRASEWEQRDGDALSLALSCAERRSPARRFAIAEARSSFAFTKPDSACVYFWFDIRVSPQVDRRENTILIDAISLTALTQEDG